MAPELVGVIGVVVLIILLFGQMWIGFAMALVGFFGFAYLGGLPAACKILATVPYRTLTDYTLSVIPLFVLMGVVVSSTGVSEDLYRSAHAWIGQLRGGLAMATCIACGAFAAICGTSLAGTVTMGKIAVPEMEKYKYNASLSNACVAAGGTLGILIPPSLGFIMYGILTEESVGKLFTAGFLPGILLTLLFILTIYITAKRNPNAAPAGPKTSFTEKAISLKYTWAVMVLFLLVMGGIYGGVFTPTEAGATGAFGALVICGVRGRLNRRNIISAFLETAQTTGMIATIIIGAFIFMRFLTITKLPFALANTVGGLPLPLYAIFAVIIIIYIILGMFLDIVAAIVLTVPIMYPTILTLGFDPIWYGVIMVIVMEMGMITPPVGINIFVLSGITGTPVGTIFRGVWPFVLAMLFCIVLLAIFPKIAMFLPSLM